MTVRSILTLLALSLPWNAAVSCGGTTLPSAGTDTSTNWLRSCSVESECDAGSTCSCGRCTLECNADAECGVFSADAVCASTSGRCDEARLCMPPAREGELGASSSNCTHPANDYILGATALCFGRELPECPPGSEAFVDSCGCGCSTAPDYPRACRDQCELAGDCEELSFEEFPEYTATLQAWTRDFGPGSFAALVEGECSNGRRFLYTANGTTAEGRVFTPDGAFLGLGTATDSISEGCWGKGYWPEPARCENATVTRVISEGLGFSEEGQIVSIPWAEGPPEPFF